MVIGIALSLPTGLYVLLQNGQEVLEQLSASPQISLFLSMDATDADVVKIREQLKKNTQIEKVEFIPRKTALETLGKRTGLNDVITALESNPLPDAFIITARAQNAKSLDELRARLQSLSKVDLAQLDSSWAYKLEAMLAFARIAIMTLAGLLSIGLIAITFNTIRLQILTHQNEIQVSKLIGATHAFIRRPFVYFGAIQGLLGGITAWLIIYASLYFLKQPLATLAQLYASQFNLQALSLNDSLLLLLFSTYLGWVGSWLSVALYLGKVESR